MAVQFQSYSGGPHGGSPVAFNSIKPSMLGQLGELFAGLGKIPAAYQDAQIQSALNQLKLQALTQPQTIQQNVPGVSTPTEGTSFDNWDPNQSILTPPDQQKSLGDLFTKTPDTTKQVSNPAYTNSVDRLSQVGPAFGMKFPTPIENIYAAAMAKTLGQSDLVEKRGQVQKDLLAQRGEQDLKKTDRIYGEGENKSTLQQSRLEAKQKIADQISEDKASHEENIKSIATDKNLNDNQKLDKILAERENYHNGQLKARNDFNSSFRKGIDSQVELRKSESENKLTDNLVQLRSQINKLQQQDQTDPSIQTQLKGAVDQYNQIASELNQNPDAPKIDTWNMNERGGVLNWMRSFVPGMGTPTQQITPKTNTSNVTPKPTTKPGSSLTETPEQRRARILNDLKK